MFIKSESNNSVIDLKKVCAIELVNDEHFIDYDASIVFYFNGDSITWIFETEKKAKLIYDKVVEYYTTRKLKK